MSQLAPFVDAARPVDRTNWENTFLSYYTAGAAVGLALDLSLREHTGGRVTLDDFMRVMWRTYGAPGGTRIGYVDRPYSMDDARARLAEVSDRAFADDFFRRYIQGHEVADYTRLLAQAGILVRPRRPGSAWIGDLRLDGRRVAGPVVASWPAYDTGLMQDDELASVADRDVRSADDLAAALSDHKAGERVPLTFTRRDGSTATTTVTLGEDPAIALVPVESSGGALTAAQAEFRRAWLESRVRP